MKKFLYTGPVILEMAATRATKGRAFSSPKTYKHELDAARKAIKADQTKLSFEEFASKYNVADIARGEK